MKRYIGGVGATQAHNDNNVGLDLPRVAAAAALAGGRSTRLTLRLDADRHLRLRLACAVAGRSAETLIGEAFDAYLRTMPDIGELVAAVTAKNADAATVGRADR